MTVKELRKLLQGVDPDAELICVRSVPKMGYAKHGITGVTHKNNTNTDGEITGTSVEISIEHLGNFDFQEEL